VISYKDLLEFFWESHDPASQSWSRQYKNILFYHSKEQQQIAEESREQLASETKDDIVTDILPFTGFYLAEDYHQKHMLRGHSVLMDDFKIIYPSVKELLFSTAVSKVNGYIGGNGTCDMLKTEIHKLGLSEKGNRRLLDQVCTGNTGASCLNSSCS